MRKANAIRLPLLFTLRKQMVMEFVSDILYQQEHGYIYSYCT